MSANNVILQNMVPALFEQVKLVQSVDSMFLGLEHIKIDQFECTKLLDLEDDREEVSLPMEGLQKYLGDDAKMQAFAVNQSKVIVLMVDKNFDRVTTPENLMKSIATILSEMCDMETGRVSAKQKTKLSSFRLPRSKRYAYHLTGGFTMAARHEGETLRIDIYNEDLIHAAIEGLHLVF